MGTLVRSLIFTGREISRPGGQKNFLNHEITQGQAVHEDASLGAAPEALGTFQSVWEPDKKTPSKQLTA